MDIAAQEKAATEPTRSDWKRPAVLVPAITAFVSLGGLVIQGANANYTTRKAEIDKARYELDAERLKRELADGKAELAKQEINRDALKAGVAELEQLKEQTEKEYKANQEQVEALKQVGKQLQATPNRSTQDAGKEIEKAAQNTGKTLEKSAQDTRHSIEKANKWIKKSSGINF